MKITDIKVTALPRRGKSPLVLAENLHRRRHCRPRRVDRWGPHRAAQTNAHRPRPDQHQSAALRPPVADAGSRRWRGNRPVGHSGQAAKRAHARAARRANCATASACTATATRERTGRGKTTSGAGGRRGPAGNWTRCTKPAPTCPWPKRWWPKDIPRSSSISTCPTPISSTPTTAPSAAGSTITSSPPSKACARRLPLHRLIYRFARFLQPSRRSAHLQRRGAPRPAFGWRIPFAGSGAMSLHWPRSASRPRRRSAPARFFTEPRCSAN